MKTPPVTPTLEVFLSCLPKAPYRTQLTEQIKAYGQACQAAALEKGEKDKARIDWLEQNLFNRENLDMFGKVCKDYNMWVMFSPVGVQGSARTIIDAAMPKQVQTDWSAA